MTIEKTYGIIIISKNIGHQETGVNRYTEQISRVGFCGSMIYVPVLFFILIKPFYIARFLILHDLQEENMFNVDVNVDDGIFSALHIIEIIVLVIVIGSIIILIKILPKIIDNKIAKQKELNKLFEEESAAILNNVKDTINRLEESYIKEHEERILRHKKEDEKLEEILSVIDDHEALINSVSQGTLENHVFNEEMAPFRRLKAFRRLLAMGKNGRIKEKGFKLILHNPETWKDVIDTKLDIEISDRAYWDKTMAEIERRIFDKVI